MKTKITRKKICELVRDMDKWKCPKYSVLMIFNKQEYKNFLNDEDTKQRMKDGFYRCAGYLLKPEFIDIESDVLYDIAFPLQRVKKIFNGLPDKVHIKCKAGVKGGLIEGVIRQEIEEGDTILFNEGFVNTYIWIYVTKVDGNKISMYPVNAMDSIPEIDRNLIFLRKNRGD